MPCSNRVFCWTDPKSGVPWPRSPAFLGGTVTDGVWGDGRHMARASKVYEVRICVTGGLGYTFGREGPEYSPEAEHYGVVDSRGRRCGAGERGENGQGVVRGGTALTGAGERPTSDLTTVGAGAPRGTSQEEPSGSRAHLGGAKKHVVMTINVGGSRAALVNAMYSDVAILLVQEHRLDGSSLLGMQSGAMGKGWHGIWGLALANGNGRSGGTAVLASGASQTVRGGTLARGTIVVVSWTWRNRLHIGSVYNTQAAGPHNRRRRASYSGNGRSTLPVLAACPGCSVGTGTWSQEKLPITGTAGRPP